MLPEMNMDLADVLLILVAEAFVLLGVVLLLRMIGVSDRVARRARNFAQCARELDNLPISEHTVTRLGVG